MPPLENGDHLGRDEFERRYAAMPDVNRAELIEGVVHMPSPVRHARQGKPNLLVASWIGAYAAATPGVDGSTGGTVRLDLDNEPQPDALLFIVPAKGGQVRIDDDDYVSGAPELVVEISASTASYDLHEKFTVYRRNGVREYLVWRVDDGAVDWFVLEGSEYHRQEPDIDGHLKSRTFPGLWLDPAALLAHDAGGVLAALQKGLATEAHAAFGR